MTTLKQIYAPVPQPSRARSIHIGGDPKGINILYCVSNSVVIRSVKDISKAELYQQHSYNPTIARYSPSGFYIASADSNGMVRIWDTTQAEHILKCEFQLLAGPATDMCWTDDSKRLSVVGQGREKFGVVVAFDTGASVGEITGHSKIINSVDLKQSRPYRLVTGSDDLNVNFFEGPPFKFKKSNKLHQRFVNCVRFSPNGERFLSVGSDKKIVAYDGKTGDVLREIEDAHKLGIYSVAWSPDSTKFVTASADKSVKLWNASDFSLLKTIQMGEDIDDQVLGCIWNGNQIVTIALSGFITLLDPESESKKIVRGHNKRITALAYDSSNNKIYSADFSARMLEWNVESAETNVFTGKPHENQISALSVADGQLYSIGMDDALKVSSIAEKKWGESIPLDLQPVGLAVCAGQNVSIVIGGTSILIVNGTKIVSRTSVEYDPLSVAVNQKGDEIAVGGKDKKIYVYSLANKSNVTQKYVLSEHWGEVTALSYSGENKLVSADSNREVIVWDGQKRLVDNWVFHTTRINSVAWSPDNVHIASISTDSNLIIWNVSQPNNHVIYKNAHHGGGTEVTWINSNTVVTGGQDCALKAWTFGG
ncbi:66 kDa stress protein-like [Schistocerca gregaria]|uniref:66 kDa stress protein-like n=1 Tax=Schistocerca gregaria TaxID=7010 RepID=UPI00211EADA8|nr:66 kDa stress protein-like [Schistocerca gregaria]